LVQALFWIWLAGALVFASASLMGGGDREGRWALAVLAWIFWPVVLVGTVAYVVWEKFGRRPDR
jgi:hypothetical protein